MEDSLAIIARVKSGIKSYDYSYTIYSSGEEHSELGGESLYSGSCRILKEKYEQYQK